MLRQAGENAPRSHFPLRSESIEACTYVGIYAQPCALPTKPNFRDGRIHQDDLPSERYSDSQWGADVDCSPQSQVPVSPMADLQEIDRLVHLCRENPTLSHRPGRIRSSGRDVGAGTGVDGENIIALQTVTWMADHRNDIVDPRRGRLLEMHPTNAEARLVQQGLDEFQEAPAKRRRMRSGE